MKAVTYDKESELANIHLLPPNKRWKIQSEELEVNDCILLDIGPRRQSCRISNVLVRHFALCPVCRDIPDICKRFDSGGYHFRVRQHASVRSSYTVHGVTFCFSDARYQEFAGFDLDETMYHSASLQRLTEK